MRYVQLRAFHFVAIHGGFSRAAEALCLTQPAISDQVRKLEDAYDILLFDRTKRQISLTVKGRALLEITNRMFDYEQQAQDFLLEFRALDSGRLRIMADSAAHLTPILKAFQTRYPRIDIALSVGNSERVTEALYAYEADIGVMGELEAAPDLEVLPLGGTPLVGFTAKNGAYAGKARMSYQALQHCPLVMREQGSRTRQKLEQAAKKHGVTLKASIVAEGREPVREIVAAGYGIGFVSTAEFGQDRRLSLIELPSPAPDMQESLICLKSRKDRKLISAFMTIAANIALG